VTPDIETNPDLLLTHGFQKKRVIHYFIQRYKHRASFEGIRGQAGKLCCVACLAILSGCDSGRGGSNVKNAQGHLH
jgi:hypothetical protein